VAAFGVYASPLRQGITMSQPQRFTRDDLGKIVTANINEFGWHCVNVLEDDGHPSWSYTIGLYETWQHPELIIIGRSRATSHAMLQSLSKDIELNDPPNLTDPDGHVLLGVKRHFLEVNARYYSDYVGFALWNLDFTQAGQAYDRALALAPGNAPALRQSGNFAALMGRFDAGLEATRRAVVLDPLARASYVLLGRALYAARRYEESVVAFADAISLDPGFKLGYGERGLSLYGLGDLERARASCEIKPDHWASQQCLAVVYDKLGRHTDAEAELAKLKAASGDAAAYQYATIYAQWGNPPQALEWLETALRLRDPGLVDLETEPLLDPLRKEQRFQAIERELKFPN
jgi:tetratricopeptide (TPR) repeat protein